MDLLFQVLFAWPERLDVDVASINTQSIDDRYLSDLSYGAPWRRFSHVNIL